MSKLANAFAFHLNAARRMLIKNAPIAEAAAMSSTLSACRDDMRRLCEQHLTCAQTLAMISAQPAPLTAEQREAFMAMANTMRAEHALEPLGVMQ